MKKKFSNLMNKPITWKSYFKFTGIISIIGMIYTVFVYWRYGLLDYLFEGFRKNEQDDDIEDFLK